MFSVHVGVHCTVQAGAGTCNILSGGEGEGKVWTLESFRLFALAANVNSKFYTEKMQYTSFEEL